MRSLIVCAALLLAACSNLAYEDAQRAGSPAASTRAGASTRGAAPATYTVRAGDTLYSIAFRYGLDQRELADWNNLRNPNQIVAGQRLVLRAPEASGSRAPSTAASGSGRPSSAGGSTAASRPAARPTAAQPAWLWPTQGNIVARFGERGVLSTGIGIGGRLGQDVVATAPGRVVYAGSGLADYGQLVIVEHNETWLSAYGHNQRLLVMQGQSVTRGQKIAEMGPDPGGAPRLHFEIRRSGEPVDPVPLLPGGR